MINEFRKTSSLVRSIGFAVGMIIGIGLAAVLFQDYRHRVQAAHAQAQALADGAQRLLSARLHTIERAMQAVAANARDLASTVPAQAQALVADNLKGVMARHEQVESIVLVDAQGQPISAGDPEPSIRQWSGDVTRGADLRTGPLARHNDGWVMPLAVPLSDGGWVLVRLRQAEFQDVVDNLHAGPQDVAAITDRFGMIVARTGANAELTGKPVDMLFAPDDIRLGRRVSRIDGVERLISAAAPGRYPLWVGFGTASAAVVESWYPVVALTGALYLLYWIVLLYILRRIGHAERDHLRYVEQIETAERRFRIIFDKNPMPCWVYDVDTLRFLVVNQAAIDAYGYTRTQFLAMTLLDIRPAADEGALKAAVTNRDVRAAEKHPWTHRRADGSLLQVRVHASDIDFPGHAARLVVAEDVTERLRNERVLRHRATHDATTGLHNTDALLEFLDDDRRRSVGYELAFVQLRGLELISDTFGQAVGQDVLRVMADRFAALRGPDSAVAHRPAETFVLAILNNERRGEMLAALMRAVTSPVSVHGMLHVLEPRVGLAVHPRDGERAEKVLGAAALAAQMGNGAPGTWHVFEAAMAAASINRLKMAAQIRNALDQDTFIVHFQPIIRSRDGLIVSLEALIRWPLPDGDFVAPDVFIPLCEETGLIVPLGHRVLREVGRAYVTMAQAGFADIALAVNVSAVQLQRDDIVDAIRQTIADYHLPTGAIQVELTESAVIGDQALRAMDALKALGVPVHLDDFGTGFSSLAYLRDLPIDALKIDRAFVAEIDSEVRSASVCEAILTLGHTLGLHVIAEGVERESQAEWLIAHGCDYLQGFHAAMPMSVDDVIVFMQERRAARA
ncbi:MULTISPECIES: bifunctional diguanylate cyclase/phosphodiesterase [Luteibacter]|uniref:bifunctional diguanylate cyclase/phosphodiesterase n=1 Tax=Luteibacter TaxID=242605 RepID=UPI000563D278|nr:MULTISPECIES: EAL domain-containing protein [unclassified Luteibacter]